MFVYNKDKEMSQVKILDRGKIKWQPASFMPEGFAMTREMFKDQKRQEKPLIDEYEMEEFDQRIAYAAHYKLPVILALLDDGFTEMKRGNVHYIDPITKQLHVEVKPGEFERLAFDKIVGVAVLD